MDTRAGIWTPVITLVPIICLIFGYFPLVFDFWVVVSMIAYYAVRALMLHWSMSFKQVRLAAAARPCTRARACGESSPPLVLGASPSFAA